ncbi:MAG: hypothetical protein ACE5NW_18780 [Acidiferrobacterales bacterium]
MGINSSASSLQKSAEELVIPMLFMRHRYINSSAVLAYAHLKQIAHDGVRGHFQYKDMARFLGRSIGQCKKYMRELKEAGLIDTSWASREAVLHFVLLETDKNRR